MTAPVNGVRTSLPIIYNNPAQYERAVPRVFFYFDRQSDLTQKRAQLCRVCNPEVVNYIKDTLVPNCVETLRGISGWSVWIVEDKLPIWMETTFLNLLANLIEGYESDIGPFPKEESFTALVNYVLHKSVGRFETASALFDWYTSNKAIPISQRVEGQAAVVDRLLKTLLSTICPRGKEDLAFPSWLQGTIWRLFNWYGPTLIHDALWKVGSLTRLAPVIDKQWSDKPGASELLKLIHLLSRQVAPLVSESLPQLEHSGDTPYNRTVEKLGQFSPILMMNAFGWILNDIRPGDHVLSHILSKIFGVIDLDAFEKATPEAKATEVRNQVMRVLPLFGLHSAALVHEVPLGAAHIEHQIATQLTTLLMSIYAQFSLYWPGTKLPLKGYDQARDLIKGIITSLSLQQQRELLTPEFGAYIAKNLEESLYRGGEGPAPVFYVEGLKALLDKPQYLHIHERLMAKVADLLTFYIGTVALENPNSSKEGAQFWTLAIGQFFLYRGHHALQKLNLNPDLKFFIQFADRLLQQVDTTVVPEPFTAEDLKQFSAEDVLEVNLLVQAMVARNASPTWRSVEETAPAMARDLNIQLRAGLDPRLEVHLAQELRGLFSLKDPYINAALGKLERHLKECLPQAILRLALAYNGLAPKRALARALLQIQVRMDQCALSPDLYPRIQYFHRRNAQLLELEKELLLLRKDDPLCYAEIASKERIYEIQRQELNLDPEYASFLEKFKPVAELLLQDMGWGSQTLPVPPIARKAVYTYLTSSFIPQKMVELYEWLDYKRPVEGPDALVRNLVETSLHYGLNFTVTQAPMLAQLLLDTYVQKSSLPTTQIEEGAHLTLGERPPASHALLWGPLGSFLEGFYSDLLDNFFNTLSQIEQSDPKKMEKLVLKVVIRLTNHLKALNALGQGLELYTVDRIQLTEVLEKGGATHAALPNSQELKQLGVNPGIKDTLDTKLEKGLFLKLTRWILEMGGKKEPADLAMHSEGQPLLWNLLLKLGPTALRQGFVKFASAEILNDLLMKMLTAIEATLNTAQPTKPTESATMSLEEEQIFANLIEEIKKALPATWTKMLLNLSPALQKAVVLAAAQSVKGYSLAALLKKGLEAGTLPPGRLPVTENDIYFEKYRNVEIQVQQVREFPTKAANLIGRLISVAKEANADTLTKKVIFTIFDGPYQFLSSVIQSNAKEQAANARRTMVDIASIHGHRGALILGDLMDTYRV